MNKLVVSLICFILASFTACSTDSIEKDIEDLKTELNTQKRLIQALQENVSINNISETPNGYIVLFSDGSKMLLSKEKSPHITTIGPDGYWLINGQDTRIQASDDKENSENKPFSINIDINGYWLINNQNTNIRVNDIPPHLEIPIIINIIYTPSFYYFYYSDKTIIKVRNQTGPIIPNHKNQSLPHFPKSLKILGIGNSFTEDATEYLPYIVKSAGLDNVTIARLIIGGGSLQQHLDLYKNNSAVHIFQVSTDQGGWSTVSTTYPFKKAIEYADWDIITFQQVSGDAGRYETYQPFLDDLVKIVKLNCRNAGVILGWQMTWAYGTGSTHESFKYYDHDQIKMYQAINRAVKTMIPYTGIDLVIPSGTAIQNLRNTALNNPPLDLTRDGHHIDFGAGRYTLACTWFQTLIAPCFHTSITNTSFETTQGNVPVTKDNYQLCQKAAQYACNDKFNIAVITE